MTLAEPKAPSSLVKVSRWGLLLLGIVYGISRHELLFKLETMRRCKETAERPAKEAALKVEKDRRNQEEMDYLGKEVGIVRKGGGGAGAGKCAGN